MTSEERKAEANRELEKLKAALRTIMLAKATLEFSMRTSRSAKPKDEEKWERLKEEDQGTRSSR